MWMVIWLLLIIFCSLPPIIGEIISRHLTEDELSYSLADEEGVL